MSFLVASLWLAAQADPPAGPPKFKVIDIVFKIEDLETEVRSLEVKETDTEVRIELAADVLFDFDKADILPKAEKTLAEAAEVIKDRAGSTVRIEGHTDSKGGDAYNQKLSQRRAESVKAWLLRQPGASGAEYAAAGFGATRPVAPNAKTDGSDDPEGRQRNRRVEIVLKK